MADPRYYEAWKRPARATNQAAASSEAGLYNVPGGAASKLDNKIKAPAERTYNIRLDAPGGYSLAPDQLSQHNMEKRLFLPNRDLSQESDAYDYIAEIKAVKEQRKREKEGAQGVKKESPFSIGTSEEDDADTDLAKSAQHLSVASGSSGTEAQKYAASIDMSVLPDHLIELNKALESGPLSARSFATSPLDKSNWGHFSSEAAAQGHLDRESITDGASITSNQTAKTRQTVTQQLAANLGSAANPLESTLEAAAKQGHFDPNVVPVRAPPGATRSAQNATTPWDAQSRSTHRAFDRPTAEEKAKGITAFDDVSGIGRAPTRSEVGAASDVASIFSADGRQSIASSSARSISTAAQLRPADLFTADVRPYKPLRYVRRTDPRQVLLVAAGSCIDAQQAATMAAAQAALEAGDTYPPPQAQIEAITKNFICQFGTAKRGGIGVVYCPEEDPWLQYVQASDNASIRTSFQGVRKEPNLSRRLERPPEFSETTSKRAALRAVCGALEYTAWEAEGFDKIVIACPDRWILQGISNWIWEWRANGWTLNGESPLGGPGELVPDKDLWELLDFLVRKYEEIDCNVRFWYLPRDSCPEMRQAVKLAQQGAAKASQQPSLVRWKKKQGPVSG